MRINYNITGPERKALVAAISQELNVPTNYLGAPTFAYEVGGYHIDKNGMVTGKDNLDLEDALHQKGFDASEREYDEPDSYESGLGGMGATPSIEELNDEAEVWAEREMRRLNLENTNVPDYSNRGQYGGDDIPAFEDLRMDGREELGLGRTRRENWQGKNGMQASDVPEPDEPDQLTIEMPLSFFTDEVISNLEKLIASKAILIKKALGIDSLPIERTETTLRFPWFEFNLQPAEVFAYSSFISALCTVAQKQNRVTAKEKETDNEKYAFRCFLLRLGFIGNEHKETRRTLLRNLTGSAAFRSGANLNKEEAANDEISE